MQARNVDGTGCQRRSQLIELAFQSLNSQEGAAFSGFGDANIVRDNAKARPRRPPPPRPEDFKEVQEEAAASQAYKEWRSRYNGLERYQLLVCLLQSLQNSVDHSRCEDQ